MDETPRTDVADGTPDLTALPLELVHAIVNGRDRRGCALLEPRWRCMARMACRLFNNVVCHPLARDRAALGDPCRLYRECACDDRGVHIDMHMSHVCRRRWRQGKLVCASAVAEWLRERLATNSDPDDGSYDRSVFDGLVERMMMNWGASRGEAHLALLASNRPDAIGYALDPDVIGSFAPSPLKPADTNDEPPSYGPQWSPNAQQLAYAMLDVAARRCSADTVKAVAAMIDTAPWMVGIGSETAHKQCRALERESFSHSILAFDRDDIAEIVGCDNAVMCSVNRLVAYGAVKCMRRYKARRDLCGKGPLHSESICAAVTAWAGNGSYPGAIATASNIDITLSVVWNDLSDPTAPRWILLKALECNALDTATWVLGAMGYSLPISAGALVQATGRGEDALLRCALGPWSCEHNYTRNHYDGHVDRRRGCRTHVAEWLCDILDYTPSVDSLHTLINTCAIDRGLPNVPRCCIHRAAFILARWPQLAWESGAGVALVRRAFASRASCCDTARFAPDMVLLTDAVEAWRKAVGVGRQEMFQRLALRDLLDAHNPLLWKVINVVYGGESWRVDCDSVCYGTCRNLVPKEEGFCNGHLVTDADAIAAWCAAAPCADRDLGP